MLAARTPPRLGLEGLPATWRRPSLSTFSTTTSFAGVGGRSQWRARPGCTAASTPCRARQSTASSSEHPSFVLELRHQFGDVPDLNARLAARRLRSPENFEARDDIDAVVGDCLFRDRLPLRLHDVGERRIVRLAEAEIGRDDRRPLQLDGLQAAVNLLEVGSSSLEAKVSSATG